MVQANTMRPRSRIGSAGVEHWYRWRFVVKAAAGHWWLYNTGLSVTVDVDAVAPVLRRSDRKSNFIFQVILLTTIIR